MNSHNLSDGILSIVFLRVEHLVPPIAQHDCTTVRQMSANVYHNETAKTHLPSRSRKDVFVALIPTAFHNLACVRFILFLGCISKQPHIIVNVKVE